MTDDLENREPLPGAMQRFVDYFGELGPRWGLPTEACRVHAYLYLVSRPTTQDELGAALQLDQEALAAALDFLTDYRMMAPGSDGTWSTGSDPWDLLVSGLEQRRRRELPPALSALRGCHQDALGNDGTSRIAARQMARMLDLAEDLAALDAQARRLSPQLLRGAIGVTGRAARTLDRVFGRRGERA